jgi:DNA-binding CsgD family transcriptional regulator/PAS domain-containing protein
MTIAAAPTEVPEALLDLIYDAATEQELWRSVLTEIADLTGSQGGILFGQSLLRQVFFDYNGRLSEECNRAYKERHLRNPWALSMAPQPVGRLVLSDEVVPLAALRRTAFFDQVLHPQDVAHNTMIKLAGSNDFHAAFNLCRSARQGPLPAEMRRLVERLVPHMSRTIRLGFRIEGYRALQHAQYQVLDRLSSGIVVLDRSARVLFANRAASAMAADGGPLGLRNARLSTAFPADAQRLDALVAAATRGDAIISTMSLPHPHDGRLLMVQITSLRSRDLDRLGDLGLRDAAAMVIIRDPAQPLDIPLAWIMDAYGLTPAEARVALASASGLSISEAAHRLNISPNTVKTHLRRVFSKTGITRATELARLVTSIGVLRPNGEP